MTTPENASSTPEDPLMLVLGPIRHACHQCGTCCTGWRVGVRGEVERQRIVAQAAELGIADPIVGDVLRRTDGRCVFLREDRLCAIHARFGESRKPSVCRQFPRRSLTTEEGTRIGADPGCVSTWKSFADGPEIAPWSVRHFRPKPFDTDLAASEKVLVELALNDGMNVPLYLSIITGESSSLPDPPRAFVSRVLKRLAHVSQLLVDPDNGPHLTALLAPVAAFLTHFDREDVPPWKPLAPESDAFALDVLARTLFLRIGDDAVPPIGQTLLVLGGVIACAYADPSPAIFGPTLAAWSRMSRLGRFWTLVMPDIEVGRWILNGPAPTPAPA